MRRLNPRKRPNYGSTVLSYTTDSRALTLPGVVVHRIRGQVAVPRNVCFVARMSASRMIALWPLGVVCRLLDKSNIRETWKTSSDHKPAVHDSERPISVAQPDTAKNGHKQSCAYVSVVREHAKVAHFRTGRVAIFRRAV